MVQLVHGRRDTEAVPQVKLLQLALVVLHLHVPVDDDAPAVELLRVGHHDGAGLLHHSEHHSGAQGPPHRVGHVGEGSEVLSELQQDLDVLLVPVTGILLQALPHSVPHRQVAHRLAEILLVAVHHGLHEPGEVDLLHLDGALHAVHRVGAGVG